MLWLASVLAPFPGTQVKLVSNSTKDRTSLSIAKASAFAGIISEEESSRTFFSGKIKLLPSGLPVPELLHHTLPGEPDMPVKSSGLTETADLKHHIKQLIFPFHFFY
ncbi:hypothetical protein ED312_18160 [Sinomicrobium pectinilyticum]|uniref:Uncharacterized protein n=1 Tax=Sinomicrobium pectinilyticum TaxID=1084421 RepID=A0A3N0E247_SINP1|nr:hypothetical protein ED312_18160 [Sinomicrobium pectinilyticum]